MIIIGENINATNKKVAEAIEQRDKAFFNDLAKAQAEAGADFIDVNAGSGCGTPQENRRAMEWLVETVQQATDRPLTIDSDDTGTIEAALGKYRGEKLLINSVTAETSRLETIGQLAARRGAWLVALAMDAEGIPATVEKRLDACRIIMEYLTTLGMKPEQIWFDPLVLPIAVDANQGQVTLQTIVQIKDRYPEAKTVMGLSNISYGLPNRKLLNRSFLLMAAAAGLDSAILNPLDAKMMSVVRVADMLIGWDTGCRGYLRAHRKGAIID